MAAAIAATPAQACWSDSAVAAAKARELETMLMVSALRCRLGGADFLERYNAFVTGSRPALVEVNERLRLHFKLASARDGLGAYDRYVTGIANSYGAGVQGLDCLDMESILDAAASEGHSAAALSELAERAAIEPDLPGGRCHIVVAEIGENARDAVGEAVSGG